MRDQSIPIFSTVVIVALLALSACNTIPEHPVIQDTVDVSTIPNAVPKMEPLSESGNPESYVQGGKRYWIIPNPYNYKETGLASWYGPAFQGKRTASGETYDMYKMTAAHKTLPLPTFVQVTNLANNNTVVVRVNDRGPFKDDRIIDLSYAAAKKLGISEGGTGEVEIRVIDPMQFTSNSTHANGGTETTPLTQSAPLPVETIPSSNAQAQHPTDVKNTSTAQSTEAAGDTATTGSSPATDTTNTVNRTATTPASDAKAGKIFVQVGAFGNAENAARLRDELSEVQSQNVIVDSSGGPQGILYRVQLGPFSSEEEALKQKTPLKNHGIEKFQIIHK